MLLIPIERNRPPHQVASTNPIAREAFRPTPRALHFRKQQQQAFRRAASHFPRAARQPLSGGSGGFQPAGARSLGDASSECLNFPNIRYSYSLRYKSHRSFNVMLKRARCAARHAPGLNAPGRLHPSIRPSVRQSVPPSPAYSDGAENRPGEKGIAGEHGLARAASSVKGDCC